MKKQFISEPSAPTAQICINKSRLKIHNKDTDPTYYLKKGQEFQMEFYNPTNGTIMAKIYLNGKAITQGGLVLRPAERVFLDRYFDVAQKFLFDTYDVANTEAVKAAIENNGDFKVEFFKETVPYVRPYYFGSTVTTITPTLYPINNYFTNTSGTGTSSLRTSGLMNTTAQNMDNSYNSSETLGLASMDSMSRSFAGESFSDGSEYKSALQDFNREGILRGAKLAKKRSTIETGRVEAGSASTQKIKTVNLNFDSWSFHTVEYKLLPISQKVNTSADINVAQYCVNCGSKTGKTDKFCAKCGTRI